MNGENLTMEERVASLLDFIAVSLIEDIYVTNPGIGVDDEKLVVEQAEILLAKYDFYREIVNRVKVRLNVK